MSDLKMIGHLDINGHDVVKRVYSLEGIAPTLTTSGGGTEK
jgi:DNA (cytosine-5)-methyltransferase 1